MYITPQDLEAAARAGIVSAQQVDRVLEFARQRHLSELPEAEPTEPQAPSFRFNHVLYYLGGMIAIGAMSLFMTLGWQRFGGWGLLAIALGYGAACLGLARWLLRRRLEIPAGIAATLALVMVPMAVYGLQAGMGWWEGDAAYQRFHTHIDWRWLMMELGTLAAGAVLLWVFRLPFLMMPVAVTLWYLSMDLTPFLFGQADEQWAMRRLVSQYVGLLTLGMAFWVDIRNRSPRDYAFWLYLFGAITFWAALSMQHSDSEWAKAGYGLLNLGLILVGAVLARRIFAVLGGLGVAGYVGYLAHQVFRDSLLFPIALSALGLGVVGLGIWWQRHEARWSLALRSRLPEALRALVERTR